MKTAEDKNKDKKQLSASKVTAQKLDTQNPDAQPAVCRCLKDELSCWGEHPGSKADEPACPEQKKTQKK